MTLINIYLRKPPSFAFSCSRCGVPVFEASLAPTGLHPRSGAFVTLMNALPDPLGVYRVAWRRGDHGETLAYRPFYHGSAAGREHAALVGCQLDAVPLHSIHRCSG